MNAVVVRHIAVVPQSSAPVAVTPSTPAPRRRGTLKTLGELPAGERPIVALPSGAGSRAVESLRVIPRTELVEIRTVADLRDGGRSRTLRIPLNTPIVGFMKVAAEVGGSGCGDPECCG